ncbi:MAG: 5-formyltetrahydrofolate cyclo-ligase [Alcaligenaceae bacterium]|nr:MAG: 5-formyltetrahydrofolate cyclo-ligase [Alcaligenaceae bacterium]
MSKNNADQLRARLRNLRQTMSVAERQQDSAALCARLQHWFDQYLAKSELAQRLRPLVVAGFWPLDYEPDLRPLLQQLDLHQVTICLPVIVERNAPLEFHRWTPATELTTRAFGVKEPARQQALVPEIMLVPTLGFTAQAARLGYGGGYYDRTLTALHHAGKAPLMIGIAWQQGLLAQSDDDSCEQAFTPQFHDVSLAAIATPQGWFPQPPPAVAPLVK